MLALADDMTRTLLAIESSTDWLSVALLRGEEVVAFDAPETDRQHASALLPAIDRVLAEAGIGLDDLDAIGVATGPGSFTSLRIGLATAKGLCFGRAIEAVGVSTLEAMAWSILAGDRVRTETPVVALLDARRGEWYAGGWAPPAIDAEAPPRRVLAEGLYSPERLVEDLGRSEVFVVTPEPSSWRSAFREVGMDIADGIEGPRGRPSAEWVGRLAQYRLAHGEGQAAATLTPRYLRRAEAEAKRLGGPVERGEVARLGSESG